MIKYILNGVDIEMYFTVINISKANNSYGGMDLTY